MSSVVIAGNTSGSITISAPDVSGSNTLTLPVATDTLVGKATTDTLTNKTLVDPTITGNLTTTGNTILGNASTDTLNVGNGNLVTDASGNVGIGSTSSSHALLVKRAATTSDSSTISIVSGTSGYAQLLLGDTDSDARGYVVYQNSNDSLQIASAGAERMRIDSLGNVYAGGTTTLANGPYRFNTISNFSTSYGIGIQDISVNNGGYFIGFVNQSNVVQGSISKTSSTVTAYNTGSDYRLKEDVKKLAGALDKISQLKPVTFRWKEDGLSGEGFIAHELSEVCPQCVTGEKDATDDKGNPRYQMVDTSFLVSTLTAAIQELKAIVDAQAVRIAALES